MALPESVKKASGTKRNNLGVIEAMVLSEGLLSALESAEKKEKLDLPLALDVPDSVLREI